MAHDRRRMVEYFCSGSKSTSRSGLRRRVPLPEVDVSLVAMRRKGAIGKGSRATLEIVY